MKKEYLFYERIRPFFVSHPCYLSLLKWGNRLVTLLMPLLYVYVLWSVYLENSKSWEVLAYLLVPASGFILLSVIRKQINWPRPYEIGMLPPLLDREGKGSSMPSRHVFSATIISMACLHASLSVGVILLVLSALLGLVRVLGGVHFPKDVVVGYICGLVWGVIFFLF